MRTAVFWLASVAALAFGLYQTFRPTIESHFVRVQSERGDGMLNHFILEHSWQAVSNPNYRGSLFSPLCFYPERHTLWYSEHLLGAAPVYWGLRLGMDHILAYQWWQIILTALNFVAFAYAARRVGCHCVLALLGAYLWAFALVHLEQVKHQQMIPRLWMPLAASYAWSFALAPSARWLNWMLAATFLQCISCVYTGWFLVGGLAIFLPLSVALRPGGWAETRRFVKENWRRVAFIAGLWIALHLAAFIPYMVVNADISRSYQECAGLIPTPAAWLTGPVGTCWDHTLGPRAADSTQRPPGWRAWVSDECYLFSGFGIYALMLAASVYLFIVRRPDQPPEFALARAALLTALIWAILTLTLKQGGHSLWEIVRVVPGATAIRCVSRVYVVIYLLGTFSALLWLSRIADQMRPCLRLALFTAIAIALISEQTGYQPPSFDQADFYGLVEKTADSARGADALYVQPAFTDTTGFRSKSVYGEVFAMWVGLRANVPVVNGYSGRVPPGDYPWIVDVTDERLTKWLSGRFRGRLTIIDPDDPAAKRTIAIE